MHKVISAGCESEGDLEGEVSHSASHDVDALELAVFRGQLVRVHRVNKGFVQCNVLDHTHVETVNVLPD